MMDADTKITVDTVKDVIETKQDAPAQDGMLPEPTTMEELLGKPAGNDSAAAAGDDTGAEPKADAAAGQDAGATPEAPEISATVLLAAGKAGLSEEDIADLGSDAAVRRAIAIMDGARAGKPEAKTEKAEEKAEQWPELPPLSFELAKELLAEDSEFDPVLRKTLTGLVDQMKQRDELYRAEMVRLRQSGSAHNPSLDARYDAEFNKFVGSAEGWAKLLGEGYLDELADEHADARLKVANIASELAARQREQGRKPRLGELIAQAAAIAFPEQQKQASKASLVKAVQSRKTVRQPDASKSPEEELDGSEFVAQWQREKGLR